MDINNRSNHMITIPIKDYEELIEAKKAVDFGKFTLLEHINKIVNVIYIGKVVCDFTKTPIKAIHNENGDLVFSYQEDDPRYLKYIPKPETK